VIAKLSGVVAEVGEDWAVIDVRGVGYLAFCSARTLARLGARGEAAALLIETHVREDHIHLYGFIEPDEREWFRLLTKVQGVGARLALAILGAVPHDRLADAVAAQDKALLTQAEGVGPKLAQRIVNELKDKVGALPMAAAITSGAIAPAPATARAAADAVSALVNLGYGRSEAYGAISEASRQAGAEASVEGLIRAGLKELSL